MQDGWSTFLLFFASSETVGDDGYLKDKGVAVVECISCLMTKFGYPNDEGLPEHPLYGLGLGTGHPILEVRDSPWVAELDAQTHQSMQRIWGSRGVRVPDLPARQTKKHFVVLLKALTFECIATALSVRLYAKTFTEAYTYVQAEFAKH